jgi:excinuclease ABC subunit A
LLDTKTIQIRNATANNLNIASLDIPIEGIVIVRGPSGSGKSSLLFDVIQRESQFRILQSLQSGIQPIKGLPTPAQAEIGPLPMIASLKQDQGGVFPKHATLGSITHINPYLMESYVRFGDLRCPVSKQIMQAYKPTDLSLHLQQLFSGKRIHILAPIRAKDKYSDLIFELKRQGYSRMAVNTTVRLLDDAPPKEPLDWSLVIDRLKVSPKNNVRIELAIRAAFAIGLKKLTVLINDTAHAFFQAPYSKALEQYYPFPTHNLLHSKHSSGACSICSGLGFIADESCSECKGSGRNNYSRMLFRDHLSFNDALVQTVSETKEFLSKFKKTQLHQKLIENIQTLIDLGLGQLSLSHTANWLSSGERSRARLAGLMNSAIQGSLLLIDEPTTGLSSTERVLIGRYLKRKSKDHPMLIIDHHTDIWALSQSKITMGPGAGKNGGQILQGQQELPLMQFTFHKSALKSYISCTINDRHDNPISLLQSGMNVLVGSSGVGKTRTLKKIHTLFSSLENQQFQQISLLSDVVQVGSTRSCVATIAKIWTPIRELLSMTTAAKIQGFKASRFSFNVAEGRCEACKGLGTIKEEILGLPSYELPCPDCNGLRFDALTRSIRYRNLNVNEILELQVQDAHRIFSAIPSLFPILNALCDIGLGHLTLGQPSMSLSGGEGRRIKIAQIIAHAYKRGQALEDSLFLFDEPASALHPLDLQTLLNAFEQICTRGGTILCATHESNIIENADNQIQLT